MVDNRSSSRGPGTSRFGTRRFNDPRASFIGHHLSRISSTSRFSCKPISSTSTATSTISPTHQLCSLLALACARARPRTLVRVMYKVTKSDYAQRRDPPFIPVAFVTLRTATVRAASVRASGCQFDYFNSGRKKIVGGGDGGVPGCVYRSGTCARNVIAFSKAERDHMISKRKARMA